jgi:ADP-ribose pyrophosphatase YjhB (NUDIX family)
VIPTLRRLYWRLVRPLTLGARCIVVRDEAVLLVRHRYTPGWYLPGGGVHRGETLVEAARRELAEETGLRAAQPRLFQVYLSRAEGKVDHVALFVADDAEGAPRTADRGELLEVAFFPLDALPDGTSPATRRRLAEYRGQAPLSDRW